MTLGMLGLYDVALAGRRCVVASPTILHAAEDAAEHLGGRPTSTRRIGTAETDVARGVVVPAGVPVELAAGPAVLAAALASGGFTPSQSRTRPAFIARVAAWVVLRDLGKLSTPALGAITGHHHSTVLYGLAIAPKFAEDPRYQTARAAAERTFRAATTPRGS